jgi:hypothetical protein
MKYIIAESRLEENILYYINEIFDVNDIHSTNPLEWDEETGTWTALTFEVTD